MNTESQDSSKPKQPKTDGAERFEQADQAELSARFRRYPWREPLGDPIPLREMVAAFSQHVLKYRSVLFQAFAAFFVAATMMALVPIITKFIIDFIIPSGDFTLLWITAGGIMLLLVMRLGIHMMGSHLLIYTSSHVVFDVRRRLFEHLQLLHLAFFEREHSGKLVAKLINDAAALQTLIQSALPILSVNIFTIFVTLGFMCLLNAKLTLIALTVLPAYMGVSYYFKTRLYRRSMQVRERHSVVAGNVNEVITGIKVVKSFGMEEQEHQRFVRMIRENLDYEIDLSTTNVIRSSSLQFITGFSRALIIVFGGGAVISRQMSLGDYVAFLTFLMQLFGPIEQLANLAITTIQARTGLERVLHILNVRPQVVDRPRARKVKEIEGDVRLENVSFAYNKGRTPAQQANEEKGPTVLDGINIEARPGEVVALVGPSGSGKTTIANLLTRFYDPTNGQVLIDGTDLKNLDLKSYRERVGIVLQEPFLFSGTILDNICYGRGRATYEDVEEAARQANALDFINELDDGMETQVGERGQLLSGGQRQRVSIARALLKDPDILILDEATSSLDTQSERLVQEALDRLMQGRTVFVIAHRLSTIRNADKIVVLNEGRVVEVGNHDSLIEKDGLYASLYAQDIEVKGTVDEMFGEEPGNGESMRTVAGK